MTELWGKRGLWDKLGRHCAWGSCLPPLPWGHPGHEQHEHSGGGRPQLGPYLLATYVLSAAHR